ncbi:MAG TPA: hypothetical protein VGR43_09655 [Dehalococcoidia bacterium]|nr:hypothetical protein [Dehalococcoidia bacterium]
MERRPIGATLVLSVIAFIFAGLVGIGIGVLFIAAWNGASSGGLLAGGIALLVFTAFAISAIYGLRVSWITPILGVVAGFVTFYAWLIWAFRDFGE